MWRAKISVLITASIVLGVGWTTPASGTVSAMLAPPTGALFGAYVDPAGVWQSVARAQTDISALEARIGRRLDIDQHYYGWTQVFPGPLESWDKANGRIPLITWQGVSLATINSGAYDATIRARAQDVKTFGAPVFLRWGWEMNGNWYAWDGAHNGGALGPARYIAAWRRIHSIFVNAGAQNVAWVWAPNAESVPNLSWNTFAKYYPGDAYVDWVGVDAYNWGRSRTWATWKSLATIITPIYNAFPTKPLMIAETSSVEVGGNKASWISAGRAAIKASFPRVKALLWFDASKDNDWRPDTTSSSFASYATMSADPYFGG